VGLNARSQDYGRDEQEQLGSTEHRMI
jgi:hypothetical protein